MIRRGRLSRSSPATLILLDSIDYGLDLYDDEVCDIDYIINHLQTSYSTHLQVFLDYCLFIFGKHVWSKALEWLYMRNFERYIYF